MTVTSAERPVSALRRRMLEDMAGGKYACFKFQLPTRTSSVVLFVSITI